MREEGMSNSLTQSGREVAFKKMYLSRGRKEISDCVGEHHLSV